MNKLFLTTALVGSLAMANLAYAAAGPNAHPHGNPFSKALATLPVSDQNAFKDAIKQGHDKNKSLEEKAHALRGERLSIASADKFDEKAYLAKSDSLQQVNNQIHEADEKTFASALAKLPVNERKAFAAEYFKAPKGHGNAAVAAAKPAAPAAPAKP